MLKDWVEGSAVKLEEFKEDIFYELYHDGEFKPDTDWEALHDDWIRGLGFTQWWNEALPSVGWVEYACQNGRFLWVKDWTTLMVIPGVHELPTSDIKAIFNEDSLEEIEYAEGVVKDRIFYAETIATERN
nr:MAG TPA: hypothetical protein [Caudoviricetes sp.]